MKNLKQIKPASYNPKTRTESRNLKALTKSIQEHGIIIPLLTDVNGNLIDGHRRLRVATLLKLKEVPVLETTTSMTKDEAFEAINTNQKKISNNDMMFIYVNGGKIPPKALKEIQEIEEIVGKADLKKLANLYVTYRVLSYAKKVQKYCRETNDPEFLRKSLLWLVNNKMTFTVRRAMESRTSRTTIVKAVKTNKPLKTNYN